MRGNFAAVLALLCLCAVCHIAYSAGDQSASHTMLDIVGFPLRGGAEVKPTPFFRISGTVNVTHGSSIIMTSHDCRGEIKPGGMLSVEGYFLEVSLDPITPANFIITTPYPGPTRGAVLGHIKGEGSGLAFDLGDCQKMGEPPCGNMGGVDVYYVHQADHAPSSQLLLSTAREGEAETSLKLDGERLILSGRTSAITAQGPEISVKARTAVKLQASDGQDTGASLVLEGPKDQAVVALVGAGGTSVVSGAQDSSGGVAGGRLLLTGGAGAGAGGAGTGGGVTILGGQGGGGGGGLTTGGGGGGVVVAE